MPSFVNLGAYVDSGTMVDTRDDWVMLKWAKIVIYLGCRHSWRIGAYASGSRDNRG